jgi:predicted NAD/FAD-dependent oxidoreductase
VGNPTAIVGAGLAGLTAARRLQQAGRPVVVLEAAPVVGGRLATRVIERATIDHGAQFFTVRSDAFARFVAPLEAGGLVLEWCRGFNEVDGYPRYAVRGGMAALAAQLADGLDVRTRWPVSALRASAEGGYELCGPPAGPLRADAVLLTPPVPELLPLLAGAELDLPPEVAALTYHRVLALLVTLDRPSGVPEPGGRQSEDGPFSFIGDNHQKGISQDVAVTFHTNHHLSAQHWDDDDDELTALLLAWAEPWLGGAAPLRVELVRWRHSGPLRPWPEPFVELAEGVLVAGDAFAGPKVEGAYLSGLAAAERLLG